MGLTSVYIKSKGTEDGVRVFTQAPAAWEVIPISKNNPSLAGSWPCTSSLHWALTPVHQVTKTHALSLTVSFLMHLSTSFSR